ncbi:MULTISPECIES: molecular chaperone DnaJ [unclassified Novosphingobium]|uniref:molecular chaperone DnaJ n=1 Tax=unclassified Novosphingobium TaxID=2644732 RepID=UPI00086BF170|nr:MULTISPECIES: molecular chaperone DnaJ [unclassified Novosphingobium]MBN9143521.1 molecular chaperone DnaJ [Novosphingobium sp.]MDR6706771.1 molecular chaperone DnaJ [Novosphingobium sp. 1748]NKI99443.1 molecular chaperone DnaJ [Novosphingobium sp. SG707]ODU83713.1 MAG: molecular chaperone DnaJ [Novosphingobium sp. SCN 63-17]OJX92706.1 MAG: molecular chaperone DnaJ [Novosphingobium sp. 63-713]
MSAEIDYYELLEVSRDANEATLKSSYRKLAMKFHPDRNPGCKESEAKFKQISEAYDCLKDPQKRAAYDRFGHAAFQNGGPGAGGFQGGGDFGDIGDIFESIFGNAFGGGGGRQQARRGADLRYDLEIGLDDAFHGKTVEIEVEVATGCEPCKGSGAEPGTGKRRCNLCGGHGKVRAQQGFFMVERTCPTCHGRGEVIEKPCKKCHGEGRVDQRQKLEVAIPKGVDNGNRIRLSGKGEAGPNGSPPGDLYIFLHIKRHPVFDRESTTLLTRAPISFTTAALGGQIEIPGMDGVRHVIDIPAGIQTGKQLRKRGAGMPVLNGRGMGDLVVEVAVETPTKLTARQKELLREFQATETGEECPEAKGFFDRLKDAWSDLTE